ncbi:hypothetical protein D806_045240 [Mycolicibacterium smegmatis MKD8]|uniref:Uncharacterized protein n=1 Tax=Mycolicibacterium smegmatis (strain MKD8) TaxID=1214915 RepID=A0A2U9PUM0_MYCSE|nr:hypothetical protein D806_045240 [Mycolicibacterium smegmatis MKD8]
MFRRCFAGGISPGSAGAGDALARLTNHAVADHGVCCIGKGCGGVSACVLPRVRPPSLCRNSLYAYGLQDSPGVRGMPRPGSKSRTASRHGPLSPCVPVVSRPSARPSERWSGSERKSRQLRPLGRADCRLPACLVPKVRDDAVCRITNPHTETDFGDPVHKMIVICLTFNCRRACSCRSPNPQHDLHERLSHRVVIGPLSARDRSDTDMTSLRDLCRFLPEPR